MGGVNTFAYVGGSPLMNLDETGLITWAGKVTSVGVSLGGGAVRLQYLLTSECINDRGATVTVVAGGPVVGIGAEVAGVRSDIKFTDELNYILPTVFEGRSMFASASYAFGAFGYGFSAVELGGGVSIGHGWQVGWDASITGGAGISTVTKVTWEECCE